MLYIRRLMLHNFKSFKKGSIEFVKGVNGITGPNGSGKSTICDAILFVLGENSLSRLRVNKVSKLINDSAKKNPSPIASVKIELDGDKKAEIRRIIRFDGKTKFFLNGKRVTRKALLDFLYSFSAVTNPTNTITQEEVTKVINMNPKERRSLIDEISGIEEFNQKKEEAKKELEKVEQRLSEANILLNERLGYLKELEKERAQALLYKELEEKIRKLSFAIISFSLEENKRSLEELLKKEIEIAQKRKEVEEEISKKNEDLNKLRARLQKLIAEVNKLSLQKQSFFQKKQEIEKEIELKEFKVSQANQKIEKLKKQREEEEKRIEELLKREIDVKKEIERISNEIKELYGSEQVIEEQELEKRKLQIAQEKAKLASIIEEKEESEESKFEEIEKKLKEVCEEIEKKKREASEIEKKLKEIEKEKSEVEKRIFEEEIKGRGRVYEFVIKQKGVYGSVAEIINFSKEYEKAVNACAGSRLNYFVVEDLDVANSIIKDLKDKKIGRASFIPLKELQQTKREKGSLAELISYDQKFEKVVNFLFGSTFVANFEEIKQNIGKRFVTIDGTLVEPSAIVSGGYLEETANFAELKKKQKEIQKVFDEVEEELKKKREELSSLEVKKIELQTSLEYERKRISEIVKRNQQIRKRKEEAQKRIQELQAIEEELSKKKPVSKEIFEKRISFSKLEPELRNIAERKEESLKRLKEIEEEEKIAKEEKEKNEEELKKLKEELKNLKAPQEVEPVYKEYQKLQEEENRIAKEIGSLQKEFDYLKDESNRIAIRKAELETRIKDILAEIKNYNESEKTILIKSEEEKQKFEKELDEAKRKIQELKNVNLLAIQAYEEKSKEVKEVEEKVERIKQEKEAIIKMIKEIDEKKIKVFKENFEKVNSNFKKLYYYTFNEEAELYLDKPRDPFNSGLHIKIKKTQRDEESFSGGEKTILFLLFLFAIHFVKKLSFYLLDEVDAPLDKENTKKIFSLIKRISQETGVQFIIVTHNDLSIMQMDAVIGVTKTEEGSKVYGINLKEIAKSS